MREKPCYRRDSSEMISNPWKWQYDGALCVNDTPADRIDAALASIRGPTVWHLMPAMLSLGRIVARMMPKISACQPTTGLCLAYLCYDSALGGESLWPEQTP